MPSDEKEMKIKVEYSAEFWDLFKTQPVDLNAGIIAQWKDLGPIDLYEYLQKSNFKKNDEMQMRKFFRKGYQCEGLYDSLEENGTGFGREIYEDGNYFYEGFYKDGLRHGFGRYIWA